MTATNGEAIAGVVGAADSPRPSIPGASDVVMLDNCASQHPIEGAVFADLASTFSQTTGERCPFCALLAFTQETERCIADLPRLLASESFTWNLVWIALVYKTRRADLRPRL